MEDSIYPDVKASLTSHDWHHHNCFGCGVQNTIGLRLEFPFNVDAGNVIFTLKFEKFHEGAPGYAHGGLIAAVLDEAQGVLCFHIGHFVMTDQLNMRYIKATPLNDDVEVIAEITMVRKRRIYTKATMFQKSTGETLAVSKARWYVMPERVFMKMFKGTRSDFSPTRISRVLEKNRERGKKIRKRLREDKSKS
ncbi:MAG: PaaI family thioesterase [Leptospiraceae bacterium]|nr:PaaI family thioesterase [Leptospiraceae bacterium]